jgi:hypothetical protein
MAAKRLTEKKFSEFTPGDWAKSILMGLVGAAALVAILNFTAGTPTPAAPASAALPGDQAQFISVIAAARAAYQSAPNEMAAGGVRADRKAKLCATLDKPAIQGWIGAVRKLSSNEDGKGVLEIAIADKVSVETFNNSFSDIGYGTLIEPASDVFKSAAALKVGDRVVFSGDLFRSDVDCVNEGSLTLEGSMNEPEFLFRFRSINKL